jgi:shikimate kinase
MDDDNWALIRERAVTAYIEVPFPKVWGRIRNVPGRPLLAGRSAAEVQELYEKRRQRYQEAAHRVDGDRLAEEVVQDVMKLWSD